MGTFVLIAGAWHGGWCWKRVRPLLRKAGHDVFTPTLTGMGDRVHLASPEIDFETHVWDIVNVLEYEDLTDVYLIGHSYGELVTGTVAHRVPERIAHLIYLDALITEDGKTFEQIYENHGRRDFVRRVREIVEREGEGWYRPAPSPDSRYLRVTDPDDMAWMAEKLTPLPMGVSKTAMHLGNPAAEQIPRTFISCVPYPPAPGGLIPIVAEHVKQDPTWNFRELHAGHDAMISDPEILSTVLLDIAASRSNQ